MDVVFPIKSTSQNEELRYSLRSLENVPHDKVHVVGYKPSWVKNVIHHSYDPGRPPGSERHTKWWKTWRVMRYFCTLDEISDDFILMNDDFFIMRPIEEIPILHRGKISDILSGHRSTYQASNIYLTAMSETQELLRSLEKPTLCYEMHAPMVMNRHQMTTAMEVVEAMSRPGQMHINKRSLYGNYWEIDGSLSEDVKVDSVRPTFNKDSLFLSTSDNSWARRDIGQFIRRAFPNPSPYEVGRRGNPYNNPSPGRGTGQKSKTRRNVNR